MDVLSTIFHQQSRKIALIVPDVVISEKHSDDLVITEHPVERPTEDSAGVIADHAFRSPSEVTMELGFAGGGSLLDWGFADTTKIGVGLGKSPKENYADLLALQRRRIPFDVITGKRIYANMLIRSLQVTTDVKTEHVLSATLTLREVIITQTEPTQAAEQSAMKDGVSTATVSNAGAKSAIPVDNTSLLSKVTGSIKSWL